MKIKQQIFSAIIGSSLLLGTAGKVTAAEMPHKQVNQFHRIEQPLPLKIGVTLGGLSLIGLELWWFLFSKKKGKKAEFHDELQQVTIKVNGGYEPNRILVEAGKTVQLKFLRQDTNSCLEKVILPDFRIAADLPLNEETIVEFTPQKPGQYQFTCGMNMFRGVVEAK